MRNLHLNFLLIVLFYSNGFGQDSLASTPYPLDGFRIESHDTKSTVGDTFSNPKDRTKVFGPEPCKANLSKIVRSMRHTGIIQAIGKTADQSSIGLQIRSGFPVVKGLLLGGGMGIQNLEFEDDIAHLPFFAFTEYAIGSRKIQALFGMGYGYSFAGLYPSFDHKDRILNYKRTNKGGSFLQLETGFLYALAKNVDFMLTIGFTQSHYSDQIHFEPEFEFLNIVQTQNFYVSFGLRI